MRSIVFSVLICQLSPAYGEELPNIETVFQQGSSLAAQVKESQAAKNNRIASFCNSVRLSHTLKGTHILAKIRGLEIDRDTLRTKLDEYRTLIRSYIGSPDFSSMSKERWQETQNTEARLEKDLVKINDKIAELQRDIKEGVDYTPMCSRPV